ncbi:MAG: DUF6179 domain-containing protein [Acetatifactor sp.]
MISYEMEELLPVVSELATKYTAGESTSLSYEKAQQLMEAVLYCIREAENSDGRFSAEKACMAESSFVGEHSCSSESSLLTENRRPDAREAYQIGREAVLCRAKLAQKKYNQMSMTFCDYGNENLRDTVTKAIPGFFKFYDPVFAPQNTIITMDYPVLKQNNKLQGIDAVADYLDAIDMEQLFLGHIRKASVCGILQEFHEDYGRQFFNISSIVVRHILMDMLLGKEIEKPAGQNDYEDAWRLIRGKEKQELEEVLLEQLRILVQRHYPGNMQLKNYFEKDIRELAIQLKCVTDEAYLRNVVVL